MQVRPKQQYVIRVILEHIDPEIPGQQRHVLNVYLDLHKQKLAKDHVSNVVLANMQMEKNN